MLIIYVIIILAISTLFHLFGNIIACFLTELKIGTIQIFYGKSIFSYHTSSLKIEIGYLPFGGSLSFDDQEEFKKLSVIKRILVDISGPIVILFSAAIFIGLQYSIIELGKGLEQIIMSCFSPIMLGKHLVKEFNLLINKEDFFIIFAILSSKIAAFNLLPIPPLAGGRIILEIFPYFKNIKHSIIAFNFGFIITLLLISIWIFIIVSQIFFPSY